MQRLFSAWGPLPVRVIIGIGFVYHGFVKLFTAPGYEMFVRLLGDIGMPAPVLMARGVGIVEFFGGAMILAGAFLNLAAVLLILDMLVAMFTVTLPQGFGIMNVTVMIEAGPRFGMPGFEINLLYLGGMISLLLTGAGKLSVDALRGRKSSEAPASA